MFDLQNLESSAFLDRHGRFAKSPDEVATVVLYFPEVEAVSITYEQFRALSTDVQETIKNSGSGAGKVDTSGKSNA